MTTPHAIRFSDLQPVRNDSYPDEKMRVKGNPMRSATEYFANLEHGVRSGIWSSEAGSYRIALPSTKHEVFHILSGRVQTIADDGTTLSFSAGQTGVLPAGFQGIFDIVEAASKLYVVVEQPAKN